MQELGFGYRRDGQRVFWKYEELKSVDAESFVVLNSTWARDAKRVFVFGRQLRKADAVTFQVLDKVFAKDANFVWSLAGALPEADPTPFEALGPGTTHGYGRDARSVFHHTRTIGRPRALRNADPGAFRVVGESFGSDGEHIYFEAHPLPLADAVSWVPLEAGYSRDRARVYYVNRMLKGAEPNSFEVLPGESRYARDQFNYCGRSR